MKPRNYLVKELFDPKYRIRVVKSKKTYNRQKEKMAARKDSVYVGGKL